MSVSLETGWVSDQSNVEEIVPHDFPAGSENTMQCLPVSLGRVIPGAPILYISKK